MDNRKRLRFMKHIMIAMMALGTVCADDNDGLDAF